jgi:hypothetical protein
MLVLSQYHIFESYKINIYSAPDLILYVNLVAKGAPKFFKTLAPRLTVLDIPYFADAYSRTVHPIDLHNF